MSRIIRLAVVFIISYVVSLIIYSSRQEDTYAYTIGDLLGYAGPALVITGFYYFYMRQKAKEKPPIDMSRSTLSSEELQVVQILYEAPDWRSSTLEISNALGISHLEARKYRQRLRKKFGVKSNDELVRLAYRRGLIDNPEHPAEETN